VNDVFVILSMLYVIVIGPGHLDDEGNKRPLFVTPGIQFCSPNILEMTSRAKMMTILP